MTADGWLRVRVFGWRGERRDGAPHGVSAGPATRVYADPELGVRFTIDGSFVDGPPLDPPSDLPGNVKSVRLSAPGPGGEQAVLSVSRLEAGYETLPHELAEQLVIHNRFVAHTAEQNGWTIHSPWKAAMLAGYPAMHCDYVVPPAAGDAVGPPVAPGGGAELPPAVPGGEPASTGHVQVWVAYAGLQTFQVTLAVNPPGDLARNRAAIDTVVRTFEITAPVDDDAGAGAPPRAPRD